MKRYVLCGNPNCGKTTLFNRLTGRAMHTGNYPGVTVSVAEGRLAPDVTLCDLPGVYSLAPFSEEERIAADFLQNEPYDGIVALLDGPSLERSLPLALSLGRLGRPMVLAVNLSDVCRAEGISIDLSKLGRFWGVEALLLSAARGDGVDALRDVLCRGALARPALPPEYDPANPYAMAETIVRRTVSHSFGNFSGDADRKNGKIAKISGKREQAESGKKAGKAAGGDSAQKSPTLSPADRVLVASPFAVPIFALMALASFVVIFDILSPAVTAVLQFLLAKAQTAALLLPGRLGPFAAYGILGGVSSVLGFLPSVALVFLALALLEDSGYAARVSVLFEGMMARAGMSGKSVIPLILGFGCTVPAVEALRTEAQTDFVSGVGFAPPSSSPSSLSTPAPSPLAALSGRRKLFCALMLPFIPCSAKIPVITLFVEAFFSSKETAPWGKGLVMGLICGGSAALGFLVVWLLHKVCGLFSREGVSGERLWVAELPPYRMPSAGSVAKRVGQRCRGFVGRAVTVILLTSAAVWTLSHIGPDFSYTPSGDGSLLHRFGAWLAPLFAPLGFGFPEAAVSLLCGFAAKEAVVASLAAGFGVGTEKLADVLAARFPLPAAAAYLAFAVLYPPCLSAEAATLSEVGARGTLLSVMLQFAAAYGMAFLFRQLF